MIGWPRHLAGPPGAAHARPARPAAAAVGGRRGGQAGRGAAAPAARGGEPGPEGSAAKVVFARLNQELSAFELELAGAEGLTYDDWTIRRPEALELLRPRARLPLPALPGELHRGRHLGDPAQHHRRAGARAAPRAAVRHRSPLEGPAAVMSPDPQNPSQGPGRRRTGAVRCRDLRYTEPRAAAGRGTRPARRPDRWRGPGQDRYAARPTTSRCGARLPPTWAAPGCSSMKATAGPGPATARPRSSPRKPARPSPASRT